MTVLNNFTVSITRSFRGRVKKTKELAVASIAPLLTRRSTTASKDESRQSQASTLKMDKCLIVSKVTKYEYEKHSNKQLSDKELEKLLRERGSDYDAMMKAYNEQKAFENKVAQEFKRMGCDVQMANRLTYNEDLINWCDVVVPCGGDGTFLLAASRVRLADKPVVGFNSAPQKSVGRLCLPTWCSNDIQGAIQALKEGKFSWMRRTRIRISISRHPKHTKAIKPFDLHTMNYSRYPAVVQEQDWHEPSVLPQEREADEAVAHLPKRVLPFLALNEVFIGESVTSRVSMLRLQIDEGQWNCTKSSGLCVTTGTGSTSWHFSINCLRTHSVLELMRTLTEDFNVKVDISLEKARQVTERYNQKLMFPPDAQKLAYSVREFITFEDWPTPKGLKVRDFATSVRIKSHCIDAGLVVDGSLSFPFNDGTEALLEVHPEDALLTVHMDDSLPNH